MREDEDVAQATGVNTTNYKLLAFALGASVGCLGGAVFVTHLASVYPGTFSILVSITVLSIIILGGMGSIPGVVVGSLALIGLPELLREFAEFKLLVYGGVLVIMMLARPEGLVPDVTRRRELHEVEGEPEPEPEPDDLEPSAEGA
jgi:branched-chain amino acid transport system permease protein